MAFAIARLMGLLIETVLCSGKSKESFLSHFVEN